MKRITLILLSMLLVPFIMMAQSVTVSPTTGNLIAALTSGNEVGFENGGSAMWRHEQLPLTFTVADYPTLTDAGEIANPAGDMRIFNGNLVVHGGASPDLYCVLSLPKGYRFKGYKIVLLNNLNGVEVGGKTRVGQNKVMYETTSTFAYTNSRYLARGCYADATNPNQTNSYTMGSTNSDTREYVLTRMSETADDMGNQLYFRVTHAQSDFFAVTIKSFTVYFTAEGTFEANVTPTSAGTAKSLVMSPFSTNKIDIGAVQARQKNNQTFYAYTYSNVKDINAYTYIYQADAIQDGVPLDVATTKKIHPVTISGSNHFAFEDGLYYAESPIQVYSQTGLAAPIGFRIVGAKFTPLWGNAVSGTSQTKDVYYIQYTSGSNTYYLNNSLRYTTERYGWEIDQHQNIIDPETGQYLSCYGSGANRYLSWSTVFDGQWNLRLGQVSGSDNYVYYLSDGGNYYYLLSTYSEDENANGAPNVTRDATTNRVTSTKGTATYTSASYAPGSYTLNIFDQTGTTVKETVTVNGSSSSGTTITLDDYNNDAIKFQITGLPAGTQALVDVSLQMQALNPYIDQMNIVCHDAANQLSLSQPFTAEDFKVSGGEFKFYIPAEYSNQNLTFSFADLYSTYGDNTYYTGTSLQQDGVARYSFVTSPYFEPIDQNGDDGLYDEDYDPEAVYTNKVYSNTAGNIRFKFNNADELLNTNPNPLPINYLKEYPFTAKNYVGSANPDATNGEPSGAFVTPTLNATSNASGTYYVFTADETRYNIAPSTAWQHRYYAFYRMGIKLEAHTYDPKLTWTKVYNETCYNKDGSVANDGMWGVKLGTVEHNTTTEVKGGYLYVKQIDSAITAALDANNTNAPASFKQILYVDGSDLYSIINSAETTGEGENAHTTNYNLEYLKTRLADNMLFYLPANTSSTLDNFAFKPSGWSEGDAFRAGKDIVLIDNRPFYAPYDIQIDVDNKVLHERKVTIGKNGKVTSASIIMPFNILIDGEGVHTSLDGTSFKLHQMAAKNCLTTGEGEDYVYFPVYKGVRSTTPNTPYLVEVINAPEDETMSFTVSQKGGIVKATTGSVSSGDLQYTYQGESGSGKKGNTTYNFTNHGSYSGKLLNKEGNYFYFAKNMFLRSNDYINNDGIKVAPFRAYYSTTSTTSTRSASPLKEFDVIPAALGDVNNDGDVTSADAKGILDVILGKGEQKRLTTIMSDVNTDGAVTVADVTALVNMILGKQAQVEE